MQVINKNKAAGIPPRVVKPLRAPEPIPVETFTELLFNCLFVYPFISNIEKKIIIMQTDKCVISGERYLSKNIPIGEPITIPIKILKTIFQSILFQTYGAIKILTRTSRIKIIGTISIAGITKEKPEIQVAENPNPLNPLIIDAIKTVKIIKENSSKLNSK